MVGAVPARARDAAVGLVAVSEEQAASTIVLASASRQTDHRITWSLGLATTARAGKVAGTAVLNLPLGRKELRRSRPD